MRYSSRGGLKLEGALEDFGVAPQDKICLDVGSSTGGFTDCLLQHGAKRVYAVDVTINQLDWKLQKDSRVVTIEQNARYLKPEDIGELVDLVTMDVSFISVTKVLPAIVPLAKPGADFLILDQAAIRARKAAGRQGRNRARRRAYTKKRSTNVTAAAAGAGPGNPGSAPQPNHRHRGQSGVFSPRPPQRIG